MNLRPSTRARAIALIIVMIVVTVFGILVAGFAYAMKVEIRLARNSDKEDELEWLGRSGVELARFVLSVQAGQSGEPFDSLSQKWAGGPGTMSGSNSVLGSINLENVELGNGRFTVKIYDNERKFPINNVASQNMGGMAGSGQMFLQQALIVMGVDAGEIPVITGSILDWIDRDDNTTGGAEDQYYNSLDPPYYCKNGYIDDISELLLVKGITPEVYWGPRNTNYTVSKYQSALDRWRAEAMQRTYPVGLVDLFCTISSGKININTASPYVLQIITGGDPNIAQAIVTARAGMDGQDGTEDDVPFASPKDLGAIPMLTPLAAEQIGRFCTTRSSFFEVEVEAEIDNVKRTFVATLYRVNPKIVNVLNMSWR